MYYLERYGTTTNQVIASLDIIIYNVLREIVICCVSSAAQYSSPESTDI